MNQREHDVPADRMSCEAVLLRPGAADAALFVLPGIDCNVDEMRALAQRLDGGRAVYGLEMKFTPDKDASRVTVEEMAARALMEIRSVQPSGPYHIAGYSFGGMIAFETALQLSRSDGKVALLALIATPIAQRYWPISTLLRSVVRRTARHLGDLARQPMGAAAPLLAKRTRRVARLGAQRLFPSSFLPATPALRNSDLGSATGEAAKEKYQPGFYSGSLTFLQPAEDREFFCDFSRLWQGHAAKLDVQTFPTDHLGFMHDPRMIGLVAEFLDRRLRESAEPGPASLSRIATS